VTTRKLDSARGSTDGQAAAADRIGPRSAVKRVKGARSPVAVKAAAKAVTTKPTPAELALTREDLQGLDRDQIRRLAERGIPAGVRSYAAHKAHDQIRADKQKAERAGADYVPRYALREAAAGEEGAKRSSVRGRK